MAKKKKKRSGNLLVSLTPSILAIAIAGYSLNSLVGDDLRAKFLNNSINDKYVTESSVTVDSETSNVVPDTTEIDTEEIVVEVTEEPEEIIPEVVITPEAQDTYLLDHDYQFLDIDFDGLNEVNEEVVGYIDIPNTTISYPVLQGIDNDYYLSHGIDGRTLNTGAIYVDSEVDLSLGDTSETVQDRSISIFGHHMRDGSMFKDLMKFKKQSFVDQNPYAVYYSEDGSIYALEVVACYITSGSTDRYTRFMNLDDQASLDALNAFIDENALTTTPVEFELGDKIVATVTCSYEYDNYRCVVLYKAVKQYESYLEANEASRAR